MHQPLPHMLALGMLALGAWGCDVLDPPPSPRPPDTVALDDPALEAALFDPTLSCHQRMDAALDLWPCRSHDTAIGEEVRCDLRAPWSQLVFSCGPAEVPLVPDPETVFAQRIELGARPGQAERLKERVAARFGECSVAGVGPAVGEPPRYPGDEGVRACFLPPRTPPGTETSVSSQLRRFPDGEVGYPSGLFLLADDSERPEVFGRLVIDTLLLDPPARRAANGLMADVLSL